MSWEYRWSLQHVDTIVCIGHVEERMSDPEILWHNRLKYERAPFRMTGVLTLPWNGKFFHAWCMQSMLPSILGKSLDSLINNRREVSAAFGSLKYYLHPKLKAFLRI
jgi:hypothetical protein